MTFTTYPITPATQAALRQVELDPADVERVVRQALAEDLEGGEDVTSVATIPADDMSTADYVVRRFGVMGGIPVLAATLEIGLGENANVVIHSRDGEMLLRDDLVATVTAPTIQLLTIERTSLNILCRLSGIATATRQWVEALAGTGAKVRDTRKTTPGLRHLEKYAVRCGGGTNHRHGLHDAVLIKDNHVAAAGGVGAALDAVYRRYADRAMEIQVEVDNLDELREALEHGASQIMLDNMSAAEMTDAVAVVRATRPEVLIEASGGLTIESAQAVARTGVDFLAIGALTHSSPILDIALDFRAEP